MFGWIAPQIHTYDFDTVGGTAQLRYLVAPPNTPLKIVGVMLVCTAAVVAHATEIAPVVLTDRGAAGAGSTVVATITNDSDVATAAGTRTLSQGYAAKTAVINNFDSNPYELAAGNVLEINLDNATSDPEMSVMVLTKNGD